MAMSHWETGAGTKPATAGAAAQSLQVAGILVLEAAPQSRAAAKQPVGAAQLLQVVGAGEHLKAAAGKREQVGAAKRATLAAKRLEAAKLSQAVEAR